MKSKFVKIGATYYMVSVLYKDGSYERLNVETAPWVSYDLERRKNILVVPSSCFDGAHTRLLDDINMYTVKIKCDNKFHGIRLN